MNEKMYRFDFYKNRKIYFGISIVLIVVGILASVILGPKLDIQFAGGAMVKYSVEGGDITQEEVRDVIKEQMGMDCSVTVNQDISTGANQVTVSFAGNQSISPDQQTQVATVLTEAFDELTFNLLESNSVEATMGARFFQKCLVCLAITAVFLLLYITLRFKKIGGFSAGVTAIVALVHDVLIAFCLFVVCGMSINDVFIAVILTILGYSLNSTIVIYDRVRENKRKLGPKVKYEDLMNLSLNQTLGRTLLTSLTTFLALVVVLIVAVLFNIDTVVTFALPMMAGVAAGCFSSQCIAPNLFAMWQIHKREKMDSAKKA
jgi:preprotein translocase SecF subunit